MNLTLSQQLAWLERYTTSALVAGRPDTILRSVDTLAIECYHAGEIRLGVMVGWLAVIETIGLLAPAMAAIIPFLARRTVLREACLPRGWPAPGGSDGPDQQKGSAP